MIYSVWDNGARRYDYYEGGKATATHAGAPPRASSSSLGATPEQAAWPLPPGARRVGSGDLARGRVASLDGNDGGGVDIKMAVIYGAIGYLLWRSIR
jgi:hypothetical protein